MQSTSKIVITVEKQFNDELDFNGGKIYLDPSFRPEWNAIPYGTVHSVPNRNQVFDDEDFYHNVQVGDKLYINYGVIMDRDNLILHEGKEYWTVDYYMALAVVRDGNIIPVGKHILIEPVVEEIKNDFIIIPDTAKKVIKNEGIVFASNDDQIPKGSYVGFETKGMFENVIEGHKLFVMYNSNILWKKV